MFLRAHRAGFPLRTPLLLLAQRYVTTLPRLSAVRLDGEPPRWETGAVQV
jgi:hypothetical protein